MDPFKVLLLIVELWQLARRVSSDEEGVSLPSLGDCIRADHRRLDGLDNLQGFLGKYPNLK